MANHKKKYNKPTAPKKETYPRVVDSDEEGTLVRYSRNSVSWIPRREGQR